MEEATAALIAWQEEHAEFVASFKVMGRGRQISWDSLWHVIPTLPDEVLIFIHKIAYSRARQQAVRAGQAHNEDFISDRQLDAFQQCLRQAPRFDPARGKISTFLTNAANFGVLRYKARRQTMKRRDTAANREEFMIEQGQGARLGHFDSGDDMFFAVSQDDPEKRAEMLSILRDAEERGVLPEGWEDDPDEAARRARRKKTSP